MSDTITIAIIAGISTCLGGVVVALINGLVQRRKTIVESRLTERRDTIADRDSLIETLRKDVHDLKAEVITQRKDSEDFKVAQRAETALLRGEVQQVRDHNNALISWIYRAIAVFRKHDLLDEIPQPTPDGITI